MAGLTKSGVLRQIAGSFDLRLRKRVGDRRLALVVYGEVLAAVVPKDAVLNGQLGIPSRLDSSTVDHRSGNVVGDGDVVERQCGTNAALIAVDIHGRPFAIRLGFVAVDEIVVHRRIGPLISEKTRRRATVRSCPQRYCWKVCSARLC